MRTKARTTRTLLTMAGLILAALPAAGQGVGKAESEKLMYTTYFYTAGEAVVHGYENGTSVRIASLGQKGTVWEGTIKQGETKLIPTGQGVFAFLSDKKASILVGTPSKCAVVGYWVRDRDGSFRSDHFYTQLPSQTHGNNVKVLVWAYADTTFQVANVSTDKVIHKGKLKAGTSWEMDKGVLAGMPNHVIEVSAEKKNVAVQVYYDEGFYVPSVDGRAAGRDFYTYVGDITNQVNDLQLFSYATPAKVKVVDRKTGKTLYSGPVEADGVKTLTLTNKYVRITADREIVVAVSPYEHYTSGYYEHHFAAGQEGGGIENNFLLTTPGELWVFSYYDRNEIKVTNRKTGKEIWSGTLQSGQVADVRPGHGFYQVKSTKGVSVMGGFGACGAEFSPAGGMFAVDEQLFAIVQRIKEQRLERARAEGRVLAEEELNAPLTHDEAVSAQKALSTGAASTSGPAARMAPAAAPQPLSIEEIQERAAKMKTTRTVHEKKKKK